MTNSSAMSSYNSSTVLTTFTNSVSHIVTSSPRTSFAVTTASESGCVTLVSPPRRSLVQSLAVVPPSTSHLVSDLCLRHPHFPHLTPYIECLGEWFPGNTHYPTRTGDVWSLGIILVNLVCGRNPWRIASPHDESFNAFLNDPDFLRRILPISRQCLDILTQIFTVDPAERITITQLRQLILEIDSFSMDEEELRATHLAAQQASSSPVRVIPPKYYPSSPASPYGTDSWQGSNFDQETPSLRTDSGSPSPPIRRSASSSSSAAASSLPPTPLLSADEAGPIPPTSSQVWEALKHQTHESRRRSVPTIPSVELRIEPSPDVMSDGRNPFFR